jgi:hypothetical protein
MPLLIEILMFFFSDLPFENGEKNQLREITRGFSLSESDE